MKWSGKIEFVGEDFAGRVAGLRVVADGPFGTCASARSSSVLFTRDRGQSCPSMAVSPMCPDTVPHDHPRCRSDSDKAGYFTRPLVPCPRLATQSVTTFPDRSAQHASDLHTPIALARILHV